MHSPSESCVFFKATGPLDKVQGGTEAEKVFFSPLCPPFSKRGDRFDLGIMLMQQNMEAFH